MPKSFTQYVLVGLSSSPPVSAVQVSTVEVQFMQVFCLLAVFQL